MKLEMASFEDSLSHGVCKAFKAATSCNYIQNDQLDLHLKIWLQPYELIPRPLPDWAVHILELFEEYASQRRETLNSSKNKVLLYKNKFYI